MKSLYNHNLQTDSISLQHNGVQRDIGIKLKKKIVESVSNGIQ